VCSRPAGPAAERAPRPFTPKKIELASTFADQAMIAIENVRLFDKIEKKNQQLEQTSENKHSSCPA
jgi:GAF domain-containing protein